MSLRYKILIIVSSISVLLFLLLSFFSYYVFLNFTRDIEEKFTLENLEKVNNNIEYELYEFSQEAAGFAQWTPIYNFIKTKRHSYIDNNISETDFEVYRIDYVAIIDLEKNTIFSHSNDPESKIMFKSLLSNLLEKEIVNNCIKNFKEISGFYVFDNNCYLISVQPVRDTLKVMDINGYLIACRNFENLRIFNLGDSEQRLSHETFVYNSKNPEDNNIRSSLLYSSILSVRNNSLNEITSYSLLKDISGKPAIILKYFYKSDILNIGPRAAIIFTTVSVLLIILFISVAILLIEKIIISRIESLNESVNLIAENKRFNLAYLPDKNILKSNDEIENLNNNIFKMLSSVGYKYNMEKLVIKIASDFINLENGKHGDFLKKSLALIGSFTGSDIAFIAKFTEDEKETSVIYEWTPDGINNSIRFLKNVPVETISLAYNSLKNEGVFFINSIKELPEEAVLIKKLYEEINIKSTIGVSMFNNNKLIGFTGLGTFIDEKVWSEEDVELLKNISNIFAACIVKHNI